MESGHEPTVVTLYNDLSMVAEAIRALAQTLRDREAFVSKDQLSGIISSMLVTQQQLAAAISALDISLDLSAYATIAQLNAAVALDLPLAGGIMTGGIELGGSPALKYPDGNTMVDGAGNLLLPQNSGSHFYDQTHTPPANGQVMGADYNANPAAKWIFPQYANGNPITDSSSNLYWPNGNALINAFGNIYYSDANLLATFDALCYPGNLGPLADASGNLLSTAGGNSLISNAIYPLVYANSNPLADLSNNLRLDTSGVGDFLDAAGTASAAAGVGYFLGANASGGPTWQEVPGADGVFDYANTNPLTDSSSNLYTGGPYAFQALLADAFGNMYYPGYGVNPGSVPLSPGTSGLLVDASYNNLYVLAGLYDSAGSLGAFGQVPTSDGSNMEWQLPGYSPSVSGNWNGTPPDTLPDATDRLAAWIASNATVFTTLGITTQP